MGRATLSGMTDTKPQAPDADQEAADQAVAQAAQEAADQEAALQVEAELKAQGEATQAEADRLAKAARPKRRRGKPAPLNPHDYDRSW